MRFLKGSVFVLLFVVSPAAQSSQSPALEHAQQELTRIRGLVEAGAMPRATLEAAEREVAEAGDEALLSERLYGKAAVTDVSGDEAQEMLRAAERQVERQKAKLDSQRQLIEQGVLPRTELTSLTEELDRRQKTLDLAQSRVKLLDELEKIAASEKTAEELDVPDSTYSGNSKLVSRFVGSGVFTPAEFPRINSTFERRFSHPMPVSAFGMTEVHRKLGFDHRGRVDIAVEPDSAEGVWLRKYLESQRIPYYAIRGAVPGKATGAHIHIGPPSLRLQTAVAAGSTVRAKVLRARSVRRRGTGSVSVSAD